MDIHKMKLKATGLLTRDEVRAAIHFKQPPRPPRCECHFYTNELLKKYAEEIPVLERDFPDDFGFSAMMIPNWEAPADDSSYCWAFGGRRSTAGASMDEDIIIREWSDLDRFLAEFPSALHPSAVNGIRATRAERPDGYVLACWHLYFNGRLMDLRGMQNMCMDFLLCPDNLRVVMDRLLEMFRVWAPRAAEAGCDGVWGGEDVAGQEGLIMSPKVFREVLMPYYKELGDILHDSSIDYWWHSDGNITDILEDLVECGVDVVHPMQADCTDDAEVMSRYGGLVGGKVQFMCDPERGKISSMVHPILKNWDEFETLSFNHKCEWFKRYLNQLKIFVKGSSGKFGISHLILIDSLNFVFELFGATQTYVDLIEQPKMIEKATDFAFNLNLQVQRIFFQLVPLIDGGTCSELAEWLPGQIVSESVDPFHMTSVEYFEKWGRGPVERIFDQFDGGILHIHGNGRHLLNAVSTIRGLKAIYLGDDRGFPLAFDVLDNIKKQVGNIPLIVAVDFQKFINVLEKHQLRGGVLYRVSEVPCIDSANCCMEKVYSYKV